VRPTGSPVRASIDPNRNIVIYIAQYLRTPLAVARIHPATSGIQTIQADLSQTQ